MSMMGSSIAGSVIGHGIGRAIFGGGSGEAAEAGAAAASGEMANSAYAGGQNASAAAAEQACGMENNQLINCLKNNQDNVQNCQWAMDLLAQCSKQGQEPNDNSW